MHLIKKDIIIYYLILFCLMTVTISCTQSSYVFTLNKKCFRNSGVMLIQ